MPGGNTRTTVFRDPYPTYAARGEGARIIDVEGVSRIDFLNNYTSLIHGHADADIIAAVTDQLSIGSAFGLPTSHEIELAELIASRTPSIEQVRFANSGTEAVMGGIQAARAYTDRPMIAKFEGCYHGNYDYAGVSTSVPDDAKDLDPPAKILYAAGAPDSVLDSVLVLRYNDVEMLEREITAHKDELAAVMIDLMPWRIGVVSATNEFLKRARELTREFGIVLIFDEVISYRLGPSGGQGIVGVDPDLTTMGKIIGGGFPVGAVGGSAEIMQVFDPRGGKPKVPHGGTFSANPVTMRAGLVAMQKMTPEMYQYLESLGAYIRANLGEVLQEAGVPGQITGGGSMFGVHLHNRPLHDYWSWYGTPEERALQTKIYDGMLENGSLLAPALTGCLSTAMTQDDADALIDGFSKALRSATS
jgi:glutamate-1-semialdehyde 2,1-aminomutase